MVFGEGLQRAKQRFFFDERARELHIVAGENGDHFMIFLDERTVGININHGNRAGDFFRHAPHHRERGVAEFAIGTRIKLE